MTSEKTSPDRAAELRRRATERLKEKERQGSRQPEGEEPRRTAEAEALIHELQVHQIELEMQNEELQKSQTEVEELLQQYTDLYDFAPVGYFTLGSDGTIRRLNLTGAKLLGEERARLVNRRLALFISEADRPAFRAFLQQVFAVGAAVPAGRAACEVTLSAGEKGMPLPAPSGGRSCDEAGRHMHIEALVTKDGQECRAVMIDITRRRQAEADSREIHARIERNLKGAIEVISQAIERRGPCAPGHHQRVAALASSIAKEMGLTAFQLQGIELAAAVYDIGLMSIPLEFLQDTRRLEGILLALYQGYPQSGYDALKKIEFPWPVPDIILQHRECFDGSGFPQGIKGADILMEARVIAVADAIEELTSNKAYRSALVRDKALEVISNHSGSLYDPDVVSACQKLMNEKNQPRKGDGQGG